MQLKKMKNMKKVKGKRVLIVDEVDDTRTTLAYSVEQIKKHEVAAVGVLVIHNKKKPKRTNLSSDVKYFSGEEIDDKWVIFFQSLLFTSFNQIISNNELDCLSLGCSRY